MTLATALAILGALNGSAEVILKITEDLKASGHPIGADLSPAHYASIIAALSAVHSATPALAAADVEWDADHGGE
jgi:hypothetical protein